MLHTKMSIKRHLRQIEITPLSYLMFSKMLGLISIPYENIAINENRVYVIKQNDNAITTAKKPLLLDLGLCIDVQIGKKLMMNPYEVITILKLSRSLSLQKGRSDASCMISIMECYSNKDSPEINLDAKTISNDNIPTNIS